jgi:hypothetical protein
MGGHIGKPLGFIKLIEILHGHLEPGIRSDTGVAV